MIGPNEIWATAISKKTGQPKTRVWCGTTTSTAPTTKIHRGAGESSVLRDPRHHPPNTIDSGQYTLNAWEPRDNVVGFIARIDVGEEKIRMEGKGWWRCRCCSRAHVRSPDATKQRPSSPCRQSPPWGQPKPTRFLFWAWAAVLQAAAARRHPSARSVTDTLPCHYSRLLHLTSPRVLDALLFCRSN